MKYSGSARDSSERAAPAESDRRYFLAAATAITVLVFAGFAKTYYLRGVAGLPPLPMRLHVHGAVMTGWVLVVLVQVWLVRVRRIAWHRALGWVGSAIAGLVVVIGSMTTLAAAAREVHRHSSEAAGQLTVLGLELTQMELFAILAAAAIARRREPGDHKRLMLLATLCLLPSPISRLPISFGQNVAILLWFDFFAVALVAADCWRIRRLHPAYGWGLALLLGGLNVAFLGAYSATLQRFAEWLVS